MAPSADGTTPPTVLNCIENSGVQAVGACALAAPSKASTIQRRFVRCDIFPPTMPQIEGAWFGLTGIGTGNVALQLLDGLLVGTDDPIHQIANRQDPDDTFSFEHR